MQQISKILLFFYDFVIHSSTIPKFLKMNYFVLK